MPIPIRIGRKTRIGDFPCVVIDYAFPEQRRPSLLAGDASAGENACSHAAMLRPASSNTRTLKRMGGASLRNTPPLAYRLMRNAHSMTTRTSARPSTWMSPDQLIEICGTVAHEARKRRLISILLAKLTSPVFQHWALSYLPFGRAVRGFRREFFWALLPRTAFCSETRGEALSPSTRGSGIMPCGRDLSSDADPAGRLASGRKTPSRSRNFPRSRRPAAGSVPCSRRSPSGCRHSNASGGGTVEALVEAPVFRVGLPKHNQRICMSLFV